MLLINAVLINSHKEEELRNMIYSWIDNPESMSATSLPRIFLAVR